MLAKRIIPCLDVKDGRVVKGVKFQNHRDMGDPAELAEIYSKNGADELVFYDITASPEGREVDLSWVKKVGEKISIPFTVAGGISSVEMARQVLNAGADKVSINTPALKNPDLINELSAVFGNQCVVIGIDTKNGEIYKNTGNPNKMSKDPWTIIEWIVEVQKRGAGEIVLNSMSQDGEKNGFDLELLRKVKPYLDVPVVASGGAGKVEHFEAIFRENLAEAGLAASIFHSGEVQIGNLKSYLRDEEICVR
jgi:cyclase